MTPITRESLIVRFQNIHGNRYDYSEMVWRGREYPVDIICRIHGRFQQLYVTHLRGTNCRKCYEVKRSRQDNARTLGIKPYTWEQILQEFRRVHGDHYDYTGTGSHYINKSTPVPIRCPEHGEFTVVPVNHIKAKGHSCHSCNVRSRKTTTSGIIQRFRAANPTWTDDYSKVEYQDMHKKVEIICLTHGSFNITPANYIRHHGCPSCWQNQPSSPEKSWGIALEEALELPLASNQKVLGGRWGAVDFVVGGKKLVIEYDGRYWHSRANSLDKDTRKTAELVARGYTVVRLRVSGEDTRLPLLGAVPEAINIFITPLPEPASVNEVLRHLRPLIVADCSNL